MHNVTNITESIYYIGASDRRLALFENVYPIPEGVSYNSYFIDDEKTAVIDTVDKSVSGGFFENIAHLLHGRSLDYVIVNHMEPDHAATLGELMEKYPSAKVVCNAKILAMIKQFFSFDIDSSAVIVKEGEPFSIGSHVFHFVMAPMVHWPEVMVTYESTEKVLFSADAFGVFGALSGNIFADRLEFDIKEARRYYTNIVGKYGTQVRALLAKASTLEIAFICPLHGPVWRKDFSYIIDKYDKWSSYTPEDKAVAVFYGSIYGNTQNVAEVLCTMLSKRGIDNIALYDVSKTHPSYLIAEAFRCSNLVFASSTYNAGIFVNMETFIHDLVSHNIQNRTVSIIENGSWAPTSGSLMRKLIESCKNMTVLPTALSVKSSMKPEQLDTLSAMADEIAASLIPEEQSSEITETAIEPNAMFKLSYGLFVLSANNNGKDNGCIINTVMQVTDNPKRITIAINKANYTHDMIMKDGRFNVSILSTDADFALFKNFGFASGKDTDKFTPYSESISRSANGLYYLTHFTNAYISAKVISVQDFGTHSVFTADVVEAKVLSDIPSMTYEYYFENVKPKPVTEENKTGYVCKICGYVYEGDVLPEDYVCPLCKHGPEDFEKI